MERSHPREFSPDWATRADVFQGIERRDRSRNVKSAIWSYLPCCFDYLLCLILGCQQLLYSVPGSFHFRFFSDRRASRSGCPSSSSLTPRFVSVPAACWAPGHRRCPRHVPEARLLSRAPEPRPVIVRPSVAVPVDDLRPTTGVAGALVTRRPTSDASPAPAALRCPEGEPLVLRREVVGPCLSRRVALMSIP